MKRFFYIWLTVVLAVTTCKTSRAQESDLQVQQETILEGLNRPTAMAIQPGTDSVFVSEAGAGRVIKVEEGSIVPVVGGFELQDSEETGFACGPVGIEFLSDRWLMVSHLSSRGGSKLVVGFDVEGLTEQKIAEKPDVRAKLTVRGQQEILHLGQMVSSPAGLFLSCKTDLDPEGAILRVFWSNRVHSTKRNTNRPDSTTYLIPSRAHRDSGIAFPQCITTSPEGHITFIQQKNERSFLSFSDVDGRTCGEFDTGLENISAVAYGPNQGQLYLADANTQSLYQMVAADNEAGCELKQVHKVGERITCMRFGSTGELFATTLGSVDATDQGKLIKLSGLDQPSESGETNGSSN